MATATLPLPALAGVDRYKNRYIIAVTVSLASVLELLDTSIVNVAIPHMMGNLGATLDQIAWVSTGYIVANVIILPITGWLSAFFGRRRYFAGSIAIFVVSSFFCGNAHSLAALVFWRIIQGLGGGALQTMLERGERLDWFTSREVVTYAVISAVSLVAFVWYELTTDHPVVDLRILKSRQLAVGVVFGLVLGVCLYATVFVLPVYLQNLQGFTAEQTGFVILPGALASAFTMGVMGRQQGKFDGRLSILAGVAIFALSMWKHAHFTTDSGMPDFFWPLIFRGVGLGLIFVPLTNLALADLPMSKIANGTGLFNLMRQLGGSVGIALSATLLQRFAAVHRAELMANVTIYSAATQERLALIERGLLAQGAAAGRLQQGAVAILDRMVTRQALMLSFEQLFLLFGACFVLSLPLLLLMHQSKAAPGGGMAH